MCPISESRYIDITSGIGAANNVSVRNLGGLIVTGNPLVPTGQMISFNSAAEVLTYFGSASEEYARAEFYFGWISKTITTPTQLSFYNWNNNSATGSLIYGVPASYALSSFTGITTGALDLTVGGVTATLTGINLSGAGSLSAVAGDVQTAVRAHTTGGVAWTGATISFDAVRGCFDFTSGATGTDVISVVAAGTGVDLAAPLGWLTGAIFSDGTNAQSIATAMTDLTETTNNFGSFCLTYGLAPTLATVEAAGNWNNSTSPNMLFIFNQAVIPANAASWSAALDEIGGMQLTLMNALAADANGAFHEMMPMMILAATDYTQPNAAQNYMFQIFNAVPTVTTDSGANTYDPLLINYYGQTQTAGQFLNFYQRGVMFGLPVNPSDQNVYANEIWFKDALSASLMGLLLAVTQVPANLTGKAMLSGIIQSVINQALLNGTISVGKTLTQTQQLYITQATGSNTAWQQVQNAGYWFNVVIQPYQVDGVTEYEAVYTLIYSKDDVIRLIIGSDILI